MIFIPGRFYQNGRSHQSARKRKQSTTEEIREIKREKRMHDSNTTSHLNIKREPEARNPLADANGGVVTEMRVSHVEDTLQNRQLFSWCNEQGLLEVLKEQFHVRLPVHDPSTITDRCSCLEGHGDDHYRRGVGDERRATDA